MLGEGLTGVPGVRLGHYTDSEVARMPVLSKRSRVGFVGAGTVGTSLAVVLSRSGYPVVAAASRTFASARVLAGLVPGCVAYASAGEAAEATDVVFMRSARSSLTMFTTNSPVSSTFRSVSLRSPLWGLRPGAKQMVGGRVVTPVKNENGARFAIPSGEIVDTQAIGRGTMHRIITR